jgi:hypothetical protein
MQFLPSNVETGNRWAKLAKLSFAKDTSHPDTLISCSQAALD